jgi:hypothetical protein
MTTEPCHRNYRCSEKHSQFASSFPIYLRTLQNATPAGDVDDELEDDAEEFDGGLQASWQRLNEKGPIWMQ